jgi:hypothetical protein
MVMYPQQEPMVIDPMSGQYVTLTQALNLYEQMKAQGQNPGSLGDQISAKLKELPSDAAKSVLNSAKDKAMNFVKDKLMPGGIGAAAYEYLPEGLPQMLGIARPEAGISAALGTPSAIPSAAGMSVTPGATGALSSMAPTLTSGAADTGLAATEAANAAWNQGASAAGGGLSEGAGVLGSMSPYLGAGGAALGAYGVYNAIQNDDPGMGALSGAGLGTGLAMAAPLIGLGPVGWGGLALAAALGAGGGGGLAALLGHKTTAERQAERSDELAGKSPMWQQFVNASKTNDPLAKMRGAANSGDPTSGFGNDFIGFDPSTGGWVNNKYATGRATGDLRPEDIMGQEIMTENWGDEYWKGSGLDRRIRAQAAIDTGLDENYGMFDPVSGDRNAFKTAVDSRFAQLKADQAAMAKFQADQTFQDQMIQRSQSALSGSPLASLGTGAQMAPNGFLAALMGNSGASTTGINPALAGLNGQMPTPVTREQAWANADPGSRKRWREAGLGI